ncbi:hypothetical protein D9M70_572820 [compost metagenome]
MITAKLRSVRSPIPSTMCGNFCTVVMMTFLPSSKWDFSSEALSAWATMFLISENSLMLSLIWLSSTRRSVTTTTESNRFWLPLLLYSSTS